MSYFIIEDFRAGLDSRRMPVLSVPGSLLKLKNAHINRGGEIEKRLGFIAQLTLPANTFGLVAVSGTLFTFGSIDPPSFPANAPGNLVYQKLTHPTGLAMAKVIHATAFAGKPYVIAQYTDGSIYHFYDGTRHTEFVDARARVAFTITGGTAGGVSPTASFTVTGGINSASDQLLYLRAGTNTILSSAIQHNGDNAATAALIAAAINTLTTAPEFTAVAVGAVVTITCSTPGTALNGLALDYSVIGGFTVGSVSGFAGGVDNAIYSLVIDGVKIMDAPVLHTGNHAATAALVANAINEYESTPEYRAVSFGATVNVAIQKDGSANNGKTLTITNTGNVTTTPSSTATLAGGTNLVTTPAGSETYMVSEYAKPSKSKMYSTAQSLLHFSEIEAPLDINNPSNAGFINLSTNAEGSERLTAVAVYQSNLAVFSERSVQIWYVDVDPAQNQQLQVLNNTGSIAPRSVQEIGDSDVLYLSESGIRSLRARNTTNTAFSSDIGNPIDTLILAEIQANRVAAKEAKAILEPRDGRYMMAIENRVYVFSYFPASSVSAWSQYELDFAVQDWAIIGRKLYCRGDDGKLYLYGGKTGLEYDECEVVAYVPYVSAGKPATSKDFIGLDMASEGNWVVEIASEPNDQDALQEVAVVEETTVAKAKVPFQVRTTHVAVKLTHHEAGAAKVGAMFIHYLPGSQG